MGQNLNVSLPAWPVVNNVPVVTLVGGIIQCRAPAACEPAAADNIFGGVTRRA